MQYTDNEAALIGGLISTYFFQPAVSASLKDAYSRVLEHLHQNALTFSDLQQIRKAVNFLMPMCQVNRQIQRELMGVNILTISEARFRLSAETAGRLSSVTEVYMLRLPGDFALLPMPQPFSAIRPCTLQTTAASDRCCCGFS